MEGAAIECEVKGKWIVQKQEFFVSIDNVRIRTVQ